MRVATIDIGTNSVLLLICERRAGEVVALEERATVTRLGQGVDKTRALAPAAVERTLTCLRAYAAIVAKYHVECIDVVGTSAMRDAAGATELRAAIGGIFATEPRVLSGTEEAELTFLGARSGLDAHDDDVVFDIGGGSTEIVQGRGGGGVGGLAFAESLDVGSVRMTERYMASEPITPVAVAAAQADIRAELAKFTAPACSRPPFGIAGTVTTLCAVAHRITPYDGARVHGATLSARDVYDTRIRLAALSAEARGRVPGLDPKRSDVIVAGALIVEAVLDWLGATEMRVSDRGVRWGLALRAFASRRL